MRTLLVFASTLAIGGSLTVPVIAQDATPNSDQRRFENFVQSKKFVRSQDDGVFDAKAKSDFGQITAIIKSSKGSPTVNSSLTADQQVVVSDLLIADAATHLVNMGVGVSDVRKAERAGFDPLASAIRFIRVQSTLEDRLLLAPLAVIGRVSEVRFEDLGDGFGSTVVVEVSDWLSQGQSSTKVELRQSSGNNGTFYSGDILSPSDRPQVFLFSDRAYDLEAKRRGKSAKPSANAAMRGIVSGYDVVSIDDGQISDGRTIVSLERASQIVNAI